MNVRHVLSLSCAAVLCFDTSMMTRMPSLLVQTRQLSCWLRWTDGRWKCTKMTMLIKYLMNVLYSCRSVHISAVPLYFSAILWCHVNLIPLKKSPFMLAARIVQLHLNTSTHVLVSPHCCCLKKMTGIWYEMVLAAATVMLAALPVPTSSTASISSITHSSLLRNSIITSFGYASIPVVPAIPSTSWITCKSLEKLYLTSLCSHNSYLATLDHPRSLLHGQDGYHHHIISSGFATVPPSAAQRLHTKWNTGYVIQLTDDMVAECNVKIVSF